MPIETPQGISVRAPPPICFASGTPLRRASRSHTAASTPPRRHVMAANVRGAIGHLRRVFEGVLQNARRDVIATISQADSVHSSL